MHLGNGAITPECGAVALGVAALGVGAAFVGTRVLGVAPKRACTAAALGTAVFAAQSFNVQILPFSSVHLIGGVLLAWVLSPPLGAVPLFVVAGGPVPFSPRPHTPLRCPQTGSVMDPVDMFGLLPAPCTPPLFEH